MKNFTRYLIAAATLVIAAVIMCSTMLTASAADVKTIYISDNGSGTGESASSPLGPESVPRVAYNSDTTLLNDGDVTNDYMYYSVGDYSTGRFYMNSVLYQAAEKLATTGGKIVIVGDVVIDYSKTYAGVRMNERDFFMPNHGNNNITISSTTSGRLVIKEGSFVHLGGKTTFENINIVTCDGRNPTTEKNYVNYNLAICCSGYDTVFGNGIVCTNTTYGNSASNKYYLSITGTVRQSSTITGDVNIIVKSGTWNNIIGAYGNSNNVFKGNTNIKIDGGNIKGYVIGGARENKVIQFGDINVDISGGTFVKPIYVTNSSGMGKMGYKANVTVSGRSFPTGTLVAKNYGTLTSGGILPEVTCDFSSYVGNLGTIGGDTVYYPVAMVDSVSMVTAPTNGLCYLNEAYIPSGLVVRVTYSNGKVVNLAYKEGDSNFTVMCSNSEEGEVTAKAKYGTKTVSGFSQSVTVIKSPVPKVLGAQISTVDVNAGLRFVAEMARSAERYITVKDYGFFIWDPALVSVESFKENTGIYGISENTAFGTKFRVDYDPNNIYNNADKTTYAVIYPDIKINDYAKEYAASAYIVFEYNGSTYTSYSEPVTRSVLGVANAAVKVAAEDVKWITDNIINRYNAYLNDKSDKNVGVYDEANVEALRDIVMNELKDISSFAWTPGNNIDLTENVTLNGVNYTGKKYLAGTTYYGMPYINNRKAEFEEFKQYITTYKDGTNVYLGPIEGVNDFYASGTDDYNYVEENKYKIDEKYHEINTFFPASDYTGMIINLWNKVGGNDVTLSGFSSFIPSSGNGTVAVGTYCSSASSTKTDTIVTANGKDVMFASYAACKRGDVILANKSGVSVYMLTEDYDGTSNTLKVVYFDPTLHDIKNSSGTVIGQTHFYEFTITFENLYNRGFIPVTLPELATGCSTKTAVYITGFDGEKIMKTGVISGNLISNKQIISVNVRLSRNNNSGEFYNETVYCNSLENMNVNSFNLSVFDLAKFLPNLVGGKEYTLTVNADIANEGIKTIVEYVYVKPVVNEDSYANYYDGFGLIYPDNKGQLVVDLMKAQMNVYWTPATSFNYVKDNTTTAFTPQTSFKKDTVYKGIIYSNMRSTLDDFNAILKSPTYNSSLGSNVYTVSGYSGVVKWGEVVGNHCSASMYHSYQTVSRLHASSRGNANMNMVGLKDLYLGVSNTTDSVCFLYGTEAMYESFSKVEIGDFMYRDGHTRMVQKIYVARNKTTGRIDPNASYIQMIEQTDTLESKAYANQAKYGYTDWTPSSGYDSTWWEHRYTFYQLANLSPRCIFLRPTEFMTNESEKHFVALTKGATKTSLETDGMNMGIIESNYPIIGVYAEVKLSDGTVYKATHRGIYGAGTENYNLSSLFVGIADYNKNPGRYLCKELYRGKSYTYTLTVELAVGKVVVDTVTVVAK